MKPAGLSQLSILLAIAFVFAIASHAQTKFDPCLDKDINLADPVVGFAKVTVKQRLTSLKARCRRGKLVDRKFREIRFFRRECWGNPPADHLEIEQQRQKELAGLKKKYTVIEVACAPNVLSPH